MDKNSNCFQRHNSYSNFSKLCLRNKKNNRLTSGELLSKDQQAVGFGSSQLVLKDGSVRSRMGGQADGEGVPNRHVEMGVRGGGEWRQPRG